MSNKRPRSIIRERKKIRYRHKLLGSADTPRISVFRSLRHILAQAIDDTNGQVIASASTIEKDISTQLSGKTANIKAAEIIGKKIAERLASKNIKVAKFDRNGFMYHGSIKQVAEAVRESGITI